MTNLANVTFYPNLDTGMVTMQIGKGLMAVSQELTPVQFRELVDKANRAMKTIDEHTESLRGCKECNGYPGCLDCTKYTREFLDAR